MSRAYPDGWTKTVDDLVNDGSQHTGQEFEWARSFERERLRTWARFPTDGEIYESLHDVKVICMTHWRAPFTGGDPAVLPVGTMVRAEVPSFEREPIGVYAVPLEYERLESTLVSQSDRVSEKYAGYSISVKTAQLNRDFRLVSGQSGNLGH